ncbi:MAG: M20/M25/M40 family metallo-hydrolase [Phycisphaeraceae bacterium]|nr:M20/M25/M40 family metallo-hydrolase [Phycisphaerae bacterium]MBX3391593.1 M20/M25/M40 family metallo-hydrolase [Phycisphaeraceae bacterium]
MIVIIATAAGCAAPSDRANREGTTAALSAHRALPAGVVAEVPETPYAVVDGRRVAVPPIPMGDPKTIRRIIDEGRHDNRVMDHLVHLTTRIGPRLTGSTRNHVARLWAVEQLSSWGVSNARLEPWGTVPVRFDREPSHARIFLRTQRRGEDGSLSAPESIMIREMEFTTLSWSKGTDGPVRGQVFKMPKDEETYQAVKDSLKGAWILMDRPSREGMRGLRWQLADDYRRRADARKRLAEGSKTLEEFPLLERISFDGVAGFITASRDERVWTGAVPGWRELAFDSIPPDVHVQVRMSDYDCINSRLADGETVEVEIHADNRFSPGPIECYNVVAEIPGATRPDEVVIISGHLDSWDGPGSQGCTDNATGSAVMMEAMRLLVRSGARPDRTIRLCLWDGEEQGLLSSSEYVRQLRDRGELEKVSACFVDDGGTNYQGGVPAQAHMVDLLAAATAPVNGLFYDTAAPEKTLDCDVYTVDRLPSGGSDHGAFIRAGVPGFYWKEVGRADYGYGWHTQNDRIDLAIPEYLMQSAVCSAITAYNLACAPTLLPREIRPEPSAAEQESQDRGGPDRAGQTRRPRRPDATAPASSGGE